MALRWVTGFLDFPTAAFDDGTRFWSRVTGYGLSSSRGRAGEFATLVPPTGDAFLRVQQVGSAVPGCHLDLHVDDLVSQIDVAVGLGARVAGGEPGLVVLRSPGGLPFCLVAAGREAVRPPAAGPAGQEALVDQICLDIPVAPFDREVDFFASLTGWKRRPGSLPEFDHLVRPDGMPLRLLLQRTGDDDGQVRAHPDWACRDVAAEVARHREAGAVVVRETSGWTTLRDPAGLEYCLTARDPLTGV